MPGELYVAKTADTAFVDPCIKTSLLREDLLDRWKEMSCTLEEWGNLFNLVDSDRAIKPEGTESNVKFSVDDLNERDQEDYTALAFKTPQKRKQIDMLKGELTIPSFAKAIEVIDELVNPDLNRLDIKKHDHRSLEMRSFMQVFLSHFEQERATSFSYFESNDVRMNHLKMETKGVGC